jgi:nucleotide-binding universal stress UspA family protein
MDCECRLPQELTTRAKKTAPAPETTASAVEQKRTFLCVADESEELSQAIRFACRRSMRAEGGRVGLLYIVGPAEFQHWMAVGDLMREERRQKAEEMVQVVAAIAQKMTGKMPEIYIREGDIHEELLKLIDEDKAIKVLVLGAAATGEGPGPLVSYLVSKLANKLRVPVVIVPGTLTDEQIDAIT